MSNYECFVVIFHEVITVSNLLAQQIITKTDLDVSRNWGQVSAAISFYLLCPVCLLSETYL